MEAIECIHTRRSTRKFKPEPVPREILLEVISAAMRSPSYRNSQPWEVAVVSGKKKEELTRELVVLVEKGEPIAPDIPPPHNWPPLLEERMRDTATKRFAALGVDPRAPDFAKKSKITNFRFYGAPHALFFYQDALLSPWSMIDMGIFLQSVMLAANAKGLGTVPQAFLTDYSEKVKDVLNIPEGKRLMLGMSIGFPDTTDPHSTFQSPRCNPEEVIRWLE